MATAKNSRRKQRRFTIPWGSAMLALVLAASLGWWLQGETLLGQARAGTAYGAKTACSCRHISGRDLASCRTDFVPGMAAVFLSEDQARRKVTARVPLLHSETATWRDGFGCVLDSLDS